MSVERMLGRGLNNRKTCFWWTFCLVFKENLSVHKKETSCVKFRQKNT